MGPQWPQHVCTKTVSELFNLILLAGTEHMPLTKSYLDTTAAGTSLHSNANVKIGGGVGSIHMVAKHAWSVPQCSI